MGAGAEGVGMEDALGHEELEGEGRALGERLAREVALAGMEGEERVEAVSAEETPALLLRAGAAVLAAGLMEGDAVA